MYISGQNNIYRNPVNKKFFDIKRLEKAEKEEKESRAETTEKMYSDLREDDLEISPEGRLAAVLEQEAREQADSGIEARENRVRQRSRRKRKSLKSRTTRRSPRSRAARSPSTWENG